MKTFKTVAVIALLIIGSASYAQGPGGNRQMRSTTDRAKMETTRVSKSLELDSVQIAKLFAINLKYAQMDSATISEMRGNAGAQVDREALMQKIRTSHETKDAEINAILTKDQKAAYKKLQEERQQRGPRPGGQSGSREEPGNQRPDM
ncbi:MAG: hypothetical protein Q8914_05010 [Bacteroidota bacterium]|nr:hypothetical protein [Bacteroidota bacterium]